MRARMFPRMFVSVSLHAREHLPASFPSHARELSGVRLPVLPSTFTNILAHAHARVHSRSRPRKFSSAPSLSGKFASSCACVREHSRACSRSCPCMPASIFSHGQEYCWTCRASTRMRENISVSSRAFRRSLTSVHRAFSRGRMNMRACTEHSSAHSRACPHVFTSISVQALVHFRAFPCDLANIPVRVRTCIRAFSRTLDCLRAHFGACSHGSAHIGADSRALAWTRASDAESCKLMRRCT